tara:strand:- start:14501 stop:14674 length:174 start_codon:yes stop_codon:yes gene_type:complete
MQPLDDIKREPMPELWAPEPLHIPAPNPLEHRDENGSSPVRIPETPAGSHVVVIDIS